MYIYLFTDDKDVTDDLAENLIFSTLNQLIEKFDFEVPKLDGEYAGKMINTDNPDNHRRVTWMYVAEEVAEVWRQRFEDTGIKSIVINSPSEGQQISLQLLLRKYDRDELLAWVNQEIDLDSLEEMRKQREESVEEEND